MTDFVTLIERSAGDPGRKGPKVQVDIESIALHKTMTNFNRGVEFAISASIKRIGVDGQERIETMTSKDWIGIAAVWVNRNLSKLIDAMKKEIARLEDEAKGQATIIQALRTSSPFVQHDESRVSIVKPLMFGGWDVSTVDAQDALAVEALRMLGFEKRAWLPMSSAPKNAVVILCDCDGRVGEGSYDTVGLQAEGDWCWRYNEKLAFPTGWQPMPVTP